MNKIDYKIVMSTLNSDDAHIQQAVEQWSAETLDIEPLDIQERSEICVVRLHDFNSKLSVLIYKFLPFFYYSRLKICKLFFQKMLKLRGKELSGKQLNRVSDVERTNNPLFLKIILEVQLVFGIFHCRSSHVNNTDTFKFPPP